MVSASIFNERSKVLSRDAKFREVTCFDHGYPATSGERPWCKQEDVVTLLLEPNCQFVTRLAHICYLWRYGCNVSGCDITTTDEDRIGSHRKRRWVPGFRPRNGIV